MSNAIGKYRGRPYVILQDLDLPPIPDRPFDESWFPEIVNLPDEVAHQIDGKDKFNMICYTNYPVHYADAKAPWFTHFEVVSNSPAAEVSDRAPLDEIRRSLAQFGNIPVSFDD